MRVKKLLFLLLILILKSNSEARAAGDDNSWLAGAIASEAYSQPFPAQCAIGTIVWQEAQRRSISVEELATNTNYLSGWKYGGNWHRTVYLNPPDNFKVIANYAEDGLCDNYGALYFNAKTAVTHWRAVAIIDDETFHKLWTVERFTNLECAGHPSWSTVVRLVAEIQDTCFYGY